MHMNRRRLMSTEAENNSTGAQSELTPFRPGTKILNKGFKRVKGGVKHIESGQIISV